MSKVFRGELFNPYCPGSTIFWQWAAEANAAELCWYRNELMPKFVPPHMPRVGQALTGLHYSLSDSREVWDLCQRIKDLEAWIHDWHPVVHVVEAKCDGVMCLVDEGDLKEILGES